MLTVYAFSTFIGFMSWISLLAGSEEPNLLQKLAVGAALVMSGIVGIVYEVWMAL